MAYEDVKLIEMIRQIEISTTNLADSIMAGSYHSAFKGRGIEFEEVREYIPGDDVRTIDWNVTARFGHPYIKNFREERDLTVMLVVDLSASCRCGSSHPTKQRWLTEVAALLAFSAAKNGDRVGLLTFTDKIEAYFTPKRGRQHILCLIRALLKAPPSRSTDIGAALDFLGGVQRQRCILFLISDLISKDFSVPLKLMASYHDIVAIAISDPYESHFPISGLASVTEAESLASRLIDCRLDDQKNLKEAKSNRLKAVESLMRRLKSGYVEIGSDKPYLPILNRFFKFRGRRLK